MALRFVGVEQNHMDWGFDTLSNPKAIVCGKTKSRVVAVDPEGNFEQPFQVVSTNPSVVKVVYDGENSPSDLYWYELQGKKTGTATVELRNASNTVADRIFVRVYPRKTKKVNFIRVTEELAGEITAEPAFQLAQVKQILAVVNSVYKPQVNIVWESHLIREIRVASSLEIGYLVSSPARYEEIVAEFKRKVRSIDSSSSHVNVVCVKSWGLLDLGGPSRPTLPVVYGATYGSMCIVEDMPQFSQFALLVGHELGHALGGPIHSDKAGSLMLEKPDGSCVHIYPDEAVAMRGDPS